MSKAEYEPRVKHYKAYMSIARQKYEILCLIDACGNDMDAVIEDEKEAINFYIEEFMEFDPDKRKEIYEAAVGLAETVRDIVPPGKDHLTIDDIYEYRVKIFTFILTGIRLYDKPDEREIESMENKSRNQVDYAIEKIGGYEALVKCSETGDWDAFQLAENEYMDKLIKAEKECDAMENNLN